MGHRMMCIAKFIHGSAILFKHVCIVSCLFFYFGINGIHAQEAFTASGENAKGSGGSMSYSLGQVVYTTNDGNGGTVSQGVQHPYEIMVVTGVTEKSIELRIKAFPNPTSNNLYLEIKSIEEKDLIYILCDVQGRCLEMQKISNSQTLIPLQKHTSGTYFLSIRDGDNTMKTFKIIKTQNK